MFRLSLRDGVYLQLMEERHAEAVYSVVDADREHLRTWLPWVDQSRSSECTRQFIRGALEQFAHSQGLSAAIWVQGEVAGGIGLQNCNWQNKNIEMGYWLSSPFEGQGIATEASRALLSYAFDEWGLHRVEIRCAKGNTRSAAIPKRLGFAEEGMLRQAQLLHQTFHDLFVYGMIASEWKEQRSTPVSPL
ncbi:MAG: GNAT family N-acetyltransferase [Acidobacteriota bacterium]|nr:GNAT family N-acetyltransferase [Acidobacteriota bacterium]